MLYPYQIKEEEMVVWVLIKELNGKMSLKKLPGRTQVLSSKVIEQNIWNQDSNTVISLNKLFDA